jgi:hypothetical protein
MLGESVPGGVVLMVYEKSGCYYGKIIIRCKVSRGGTVFIRSVLKKITFWIKIIIVTSSIAKFTESLGIMRSTWRVSQGKVGGVTMVMVMSLVAKVVGG